MLAALRVAGLIFDILRIIHVYQVLLGETLDQAFN